MQSSPIHFCEFAHPTAAQPLPRRYQQSMFAQEHEEDRPNTWRVHSLPSMHQFQPIHNVAPSSSSAASFVSRPVGLGPFGSSAGRQLSARHSRRKGAQVRDEDGEADDNDDDEERQSSSASPHFLLAEFLIARGVPDASLSHFLTDVMSMDPLESRQLCLTEDGVRVAEREEKKESRHTGATPRLTSVCSVYSCDALGDWLRQLSAVASDVRRDAARGLVKMGREEGTMSADDWQDCVSALRDKAEAYYVHTAHL